MGSTGCSGVQEESNGIGVQVSGAEENQGELQGVWGGNGVVLSLSPHGENTQNSTDIDQGSRRRWRGSGDIRGVFSAGTEFGEVPSI